MHPTQRHPTILGIIGVAVVVFVFDMSSGQAFSAEYGVVPKKLRLAWAGLQGGDFSTLQVLATTITALFLHGGPVHLLMNMVILWMFGSQVSQHLGKWCALGCFFLCGIGGFVLHVAMHKASLIPCVGASGAISGFEGVYFGLLMQWHLPWPDVWPLARPVPPARFGLFAIFGLATDFWGISQESAGVAFAAHIGGFLTGITIAALITMYFPSPNRWEKSRWSV